ncbi:hypothetical protein J6590_052428 [Homalodisca vitripennis]|nr:hypothetical protein J6590_052428 [Homalodisca vitripennis]
MLFPEPYCDVTMISHGTRIADSSSCFKPEVTLRQFETEFNKRSILQQETKRISESNHSRVETTNDGNDGTSDRNNDHRSVASGVA